MSDVSLLLVVVLSLPVGYVVFGIISCAIVAKMDKLVTPLWEQAYGPQEEKFRTKTEEAELKTTMFWMWPIVAGYVFFGTVRALAIVLPRWYIEWLESEPTESGDIVEKKPPSGY